MSLSIPKVLKKEQGCSGVSEFIKDRLFFAVFKNRIPEDSINIHYFTEEDGINEPLNLATIARYIKKLDFKLSSLELNSKIIVNFTTDKEKMRNNAMVLIGVYAIVNLKMSPTDVSKKLAQFSSINLINCFNATYKVTQLGLINFEDFNEDEYESLDKIKLNWVIPGKFLLFSRPFHSNQDFYLSPKQYLRYFRQCGVKTIIRVNHFKYDANPFVNSGLCHYDLTITGSVPSEKTINCFLDISEKSKSAIVFHCREMVGRTGCLIGAYLVKHYRLTAAEVVSWMRVCASHRILESQSSWLKTNETLLRNLGDDFRKEKLGGIDKIPHHPYGICSYSCYECQDHDPIYRSTVKDNPSFDLAEIKPTEEI